MQKEEKQLYDEAASLIADLALREVISAEEMRFLLTILDLVIIRRDEPELIVFLKQWAQNYKNSETDDIIKATLLALDFNDKEAVGTNLNILRDLL
jgi:hypothetical protein